jgi:hypothetical protein
VAKYERYEMRRSRLRAHNPPCLDAQVGQEVLVVKTRPLSKTKNHVIIQITKKEIKEIPVTQMSKASLTQPKQPEKEKKKETKEK